jgi:hypothetical protein
LQLLLVSGRDARGEHRNERRESAFIASDRRLGFTTAVPAAAPSGRIAQAARSFGDAYPPITGQWRIKAAGVILVASTLF